jgi:exodeoxyribonuclease VII large subunit
MHLRDSKRPERRPRVPLSPAPKRAEEEDAPLFQTRAASPEGAGAASSSGPKKARNAFTVTQLTALIKKDLEAGFPDVWIEGEVSNFSAPASGHLYFSLKDENAAVRAVIWRGEARRMTFRPADGDKVLAHGRVTVYPPRGEYQVIVDRVELSGLGAAQQAFERLKAKLQTEGLFDPARKRALPAWPRVIGVVTSRTGAAIRDIIRVATSRWPRIHIVLSPARVQGEGAAREIVDALRLLEEWGGADIIILGRGGGSVEDLAAFNEEIVARAAAQCPVPVVAAVGHETDFTIVDFVADRRAATPSAAAEMAVPRLDQVADRLAELQRTLGRQVTRYVREGRERLDGLMRSPALREPQEMIQVRRQRVDELTGRLAAHMSERLHAGREQSAHMAGRLQNLSPNAVLARGYSVTRLRRTGSIIKGKAILDKHDEIETLTSEMVILSSVTGIQPRLSRQVPADNTQ